MSDQALEQSIYQEHNPPDPAVIAQNVGDSSQPFEWMSYKPEMEIFPVSSQPSSDITLN